MGISNAPLQTLRHQCDGAVPRFVAEGIIDVLELVHVDHQHRVHAAVALGGAVFALPHFIEHAQIVETRQRVGLRQILDPFPSLRDIGRQRRRQIGYQ